MHVKFRAQLSLHGNGRAVVTLNLFPLCHLLLIPKSTHKRVSTENFSEFDVSHFYKFVNNQSTVICIRP